MIWSILRSTAPLWGENNEQHDWFTSAASYLHHIVRQVSGSHSRILMSSIYTFLSHWNGLPGWKGACFDPSPLCHHCSIARSYIDLPCCKPYHRTATMCKNMSYGCLPTELSHEQRSSVLMCFHAFSPHLLCIHGSEWRERVQKHFTALPDVQIQKLCQYMGLKLQNVTWHFSLIWWIGHHP
jgi:hypothetical protein